jgi:predicted aldo/keto reductase-like oxidoreductase
MKDNINIFTKYEKYTDEDYKVLDKALTKLYENKMIPCTGCRYCMDCSFGVDIPKVFSIYNDYCRTKNPFTLSTTYASGIKDSEKPNNCKECGLCKTKCPQHINIPDELKRIRGEIEELIN